VNQGDLEPLACPACGKSYAREERFCTSCGLPLTYAGAVDVEQPADQARQHARKIKPQYARGELRRVATARQLPEAEFIQLLLLEEGVPSMLRRATWDVPEMLPAGPRAVMVPESGYRKALEVLQRSEIDVRSEARDLEAARPSPAMLLSGILAGCAAIGLLLVLYQLD
jgi:hypothetical protein